MEKQQKKQMKKMISWILVGIIVAALAIVPVAAAEKEPETGPQASILSAEAAPRDISSFILGGGTLTAENTAEITIPASVKITEYLVSNGDTVEEGQPVAKVDRVSVMTAITQVQESMEYLREQLDDADSQTESAKITASVGGVVKSICAAEGESVRDVMLRDGALAILSLDGLMAVQVERNTDLSAGDTVCVTLADGTEVDGRVESNLEGILSVTVEDDGYAVGEMVKVTTADGDRIGSGQLYIHSQWNVVAYSGTISRIRVSAGDTVRAGRTLFDLKNTGHTAEFSAYSTQHRKYEALMLELFKMYQSETITSPQSGLITGVDENGAYMLSHSGNGWTVSLLSHAPNGDDEASYVNYVGQVTEVGLDGLILKMNPQAIAVSDYHDLSAVPRDTSLMTETVIHSVSAPVYELSGGEWIQISAGAITAGDILLFAGDSAGGIVWIIRIGTGTVQPETPDVSEPTEPADPDKPEEPTDPTAPTDPSKPEKPSDPADSTEPGAPTEPTEPSKPQGGGMPGFGGMAQEESFDLYSLDTVTIASVTAQEWVTIQIKVDEQDISEIYVGQTAEVAVEALNGKLFTGTISAISGSGENEGGSSKFTVEVTVEKTSEMLPGMSASVSLSLTTAENVCFFPFFAKRLPCEGQPLDDG